MIKVGDTMEERSLLDHYESQEKWARARRGALVQKVVCTLFKNCSVELIPFEEVRARLHLTQKYCRGLQDMAIIGFQTHDKRG